MIGDALVSLASAAGLDAPLLARFGPLFLRGLETTLGLVAVSVSAGFVLAVALAYARIEGPRPLRALASGFMGFFRGSPVLCQLFLLYYGTGQFAGFLRDVGLWWVFRDGFWCAAIAFALNTAAYQAEIIRGAVANLPPGQREAAAALGYGTAGAWRSILLPQALVRSVRPLGNELILMVKASSVASVVAVVDVMGATRRAFSDTLDFEVYVWAALIYLGVVEILRRATNAFERRMSRRLGAA